MGNPDNKPNNSKLRILITLAILVAAIMTGVIFFSIGFFSPKNHTNMEETSEKKSKNKKSSKKDKDEDDASFLSKISSLCDTAPASNFISDSYVVTDGKDIYFKNQYNDHEIYSYSNIKKGKDIKPIGKRQPSQMYYYKGYIYYTSTVSDRDVPGSIAVYRADVTTGEEEMLKSFESDTFYIIPDTLYDGQLYFSIKQDNASDKLLYRMNLDTQELELLHTIPAETDSMYTMINVTSEGIYFKDKEGLKKLDPKSKEVELVIGDFDANYYTIYKGYVYYTRSLKGGYSENVVRRVFLDGSDDSTIYTASDSWVYDVEAMVLNDKLFILSKSAPNIPDSYGNIHSCDLDGDNVDTISDNANLIGITDTAVYYGYNDRSAVSETNTAAAKLERIRSMPIYTRKVSNNGDISKEQVFLDPVSLNKGWVTFKTPTNYYNAENHGFYTLNSIYYDNNGELYKNSWKNIDGKDYYFAEDGRMYKQEYTPDGKFVGAEGTVTDFVAPFAFIYFHYPDSGIAVKTDKNKDDNASVFYKGNKISHVTDRGDVYEITNSNLFATSTFSDEEVKALKSGDSLYITEQTILYTVTGDEGYNEEFGGECVGLSQSKYPGVEFKLVKREGSDRYILRVKGMDSKVTDLLFIAYSGSTYISKNAKLNIYKSDSPDEAPVNTTFSDYLATLEDSSGEFYFNGNMVSYDVFYNSFAIYELDMYN